MATSTKTSGRRTRPLPAPQEVVSTASRAARAAKPKAAKQLLAPAVVKSNKPAGNQGPDASHDKPAKIKAKLVRDSFTMPKADFDLIDDLKQKAMGFQRPTKKSELLRAGLQALNGLSPSALRKALDALTPLKPGRPKKHD